jgi:formimidoylglutamase
VSTIAPRSALFFKGRPGDPRLGDITSFAPSDSIAKSKKPTIALLGAPDDLGVRLNRGRPGAKDGPDAVRDSFYKFAVPDDSNFEKIRLLDAGNIPICDDILKNHAQAFSASESVCASGSALIAIGGGHDYAAPHLLGAFSGLQQISRNHRFGIINVDPHLDVRPLENNLPHSGTPFRQILESGKVKGENLVEFGARTGRNSKDHFKYCKSKKVKVVGFEQIRRSTNATLKFNSHLNSLGRTTDHVGVTIDLDSCCEVDGASAAAVVGFSAWELCQFAYLAGTHKKVSILELAELAPSLDASGRSARIAAEVAFHFLLGFLQRVRTR